MSHKLIDYFTFLTCTSVAPDDRSAKHFSLPIKHNETVHLSRETYACYVGGTYTAFVYNSLTAFAGRTIPVLRILFSPTVLRLIEGIFYGTGGDLLAVLVKEYGLGSRRTDVNTDRIFHSKLQFAQQKRIALRTFSRYSCLPLVFVVTSPI